MSDDISLIHKVHVHFIRPYILPDFFINPDNLKNSFKFLSKIDEYSKYYLEFEPRDEELINEPIVFEEGFRRPCFIPKIGTLIPFYRGHSFRSFWFGFRSKVKINAESNYLMPLPFSLQNIAYEWADNKKMKRLDGRLYGYLFPFGVLCINQELLYSGKPLTIRELIKKNRSNRSDFMGFSNFIVDYINKHLFEPCTEKKPLETHMMIFLDKAKPSLILGDTQHDKVISGLIESDVSYRTLVEDYVSNVLSTELPPRHHGEVLIFDPRTTFLEPSRLLREKKNTYNCMRQNYADFLNFTFAANRCIRECMKLNKQIPESRNEVIKKVVRTGFPKINTDYSTEYFKKIFPPISKEIGLNDLLKTFLED